MTHKTTLDAFYCVNESMQPLRARILSGLPGTGPYPEQFSTTGRGKHREGVVVHFEDGGGWVGNFQPGLSDLTALLAHPNGRDVLVVAGGDGYRVDPATRRLVAVFGGQIESAFEFPKLRLLAFGNGLWFEALGPDGHLWRTRRLSWDGMREVRQEGDRIRGLGWGLGDSWCEFDVDVLDGTAVGGGYTGPD